MTKFDTASLTSPGGREENQDFLGFLILDRFACWAIADGLGGHSGGARGAITAVETILDSFRASPSCSPEGLAEYLRRANAAIREMQKQEPRWSRMASTAAVLVTDFREVLWGHVGDSRLYLFRRGRIHAQTRDHSVPQALCNAGEIAPAQIRFHEDRSRLLRSLGREDFRPTILEHTLLLQPQDAFLLCTDGFWEYVNEDQMQGDLTAAKSAEEWLKTMAARVSRHATGEQDNFSALAILFRTES
jgi:serine/threonine protein phosphatase PrpC